MDLSSELIHSLLPLYMAVGLGASTLTIGIIEGIAEATAMIVKVFSGVLSDFFRRRKALVVVGYGLAALTKIVFPLAPTLGWIVAARFADRVGKGIRGAPRDALIADLTPEAVRGASFGLRQALDTVGGTRAAARDRRDFYFASNPGAFWVAESLLLSASRCWCSVSMAHTQRGWRSGNTACNGPTRGASAANMRLSSASRRC
jgi:MFS family permease